MIAALLICGICSLIGLVFLIIGLLLKGSLRKKLRVCTEKTTGRVVGNDLVRDPPYGSPDSRDAWYPIVQYYAQGQTITRRIPFGQYGKCKYPAGAVLTVFFDPDDPQNCYLPEDNTPNHICRIFLITGALLTVLGIAAGLGALFLL